ncbi:MAG: LD-carboxypeptidase [Nitrososphaerota archaeon]|jgi:muramoyltetrapeptide carboxypeptidase LdcA involved in peptidoglycan recycling|nr:LD-carboxypeptidase [Nitrososphaerota archaeon]
MNGARPVRKLKFGGKIGLFSPSEPLTRDRQERMKESIRFIESKYKLVWGSHALDEEYYQAGSRESRLSDVFELINDESIDALLATWGGKNASQLVRVLPYQHFSERRIPVIGFSDTGVILNPISVFSDIITFYGPNIAGKMLEGLHGDMSELSHGLYEPFGKTAKDYWQTIKEGNAEGVLYGGNLSTFTIGLSGSECLRRMNNVVFFWESASDTPQIMDQYLTGLENSGFFEKVKAMIVGQTVYSEEPRKNRPLNELLSEMGERYNIPVIKIESFGHGKAENPIIPIGAKVEINTNTKSIALKNPVVAGG